MTGRPSLISLFTGAGGLDIGLEAAGFLSSIAVEMDPTACETLRTNRSWRLLEESIHDISSAELCAEAKSSVGDPDLLAGGAPCQPFSKSAYWAQGDTKRLDDPRADTLTAYLRVLRDVQPRAFLFENVEGLLYRGKDEGIRLLHSVVREINREVGTNYSFEWKVLNTADYGVPQTRMRVFVVGERSGIRFQFPSPTHKEVVPDQPERHESAQERWMTAWDAIGDLDSLDHGDALKMGGNWADLLPSIPEGKNYLHHTDRGGGTPLFGWRRRYWSFLLKLAKARPSWTIQAQPGSAIGPFHWKNRQLSTREMCRIQTIPDGYQIQGKKTEVQRQLGNAVPSLMAEVLGRAIAEQLLDLKPGSGQPTLLPTVRDPIPDPEPGQPVPGKYLHLVGDHSPHPGTGKGHLVRDRSG